MNRQCILKNLAEFSKPIVELSNDLLSLTWDYEGKPFIIHSDQVLEVLNRYVSGNLSSEEIENWANLIECREDMDFDKEERVTLEKIIYQLANPVLEGEITSDLCHEMISRVAKNANQ